MYLPRRQTSSRRRAVTLILTAICLMAILFLSALAIDCGNMVAERRQAAELRRRRRSGRVH